MGDKPAARPKGVFCPSCHGVRLVVTHVRRPCPGKTVRYRVCTACGHKVITEERVATARKSKTTFAPQSFKQSPSRPPWAE